jgi:hypothetical protein
VAKGAVSEERRVNASDERLIRNIITTATQISVDGERRLQESYDLLDRALSRGRFNRERAIEVLTFTIDNAVWSDLKGSPDNRLTYARYKESGLGSKVAQEFADRFIADRGATDQRSPRKWLRPLLGA